MHNIKMNDRAYFTVVDAVIITADTQVFTIIIIKQYRVQCCILYNRHANYVFRAATS